MISNIKIVKIHGCEMISFNYRDRLILISKNDVFIWNCKVILLGVLQEKLIVFVRNRHIVSIDFPSFLPEVVLCSESIDGHANSDKDIWIRRGDKVFCINFDMTMTLYDEFPATCLRSVVYLHELATLAFIIQDQSGSKVLFENPALPPMILKGISSVPELFFESEWGIIFSIGRSLIEYDIPHKKLQVLKKSNPIAFSWKTCQIRLSYQITKTEIIVDCNTLQVFEIQGDVWRVINSGSSIYFFSDSINTPAYVHRIGADRSLEQIYRDATVEDHLVELKQDPHNQLGPMMVLRPKRAALKEPPTAIFFIHGGPHQKAGNLWDPLIRKFLENGYLIYLPQYQGTVGAEEINVLAYGVDDFESLSLHYGESKLLHRKIILVGHSYGAFLALKLYCKGYIDIFVGINGVYDLFTISELNPKTYAHLDADTKSARSPNFSRDVQKNAEWHHIQCTRDPLIHDSDLQRSLQRVGGEGPEMHYFDFCAHGFFNEFQSSQIVEKIKSIENNFYKTSREKDNERLHH